MTLVSEPVFQPARARFGGTRLDSGDLTQAPAVLAAHAGIQQLTANHGTFDGRLREAIALMVAAVGDCAECELTHIVSCRAAGWTPEQTIALRAGEPIPGDDRLTALLAVARQIAERAGEVDPDTWQSARQAGWTTEELAELFIHVMANIFRHYFDHYACAELDRLVVPQPSAPQISTEACG